MQSKKKYFIFLKIILIIIILSVLFFVFSIERPVSYIIPLFFVIFILLNKKWIYQIIIFFMGFYSILLGISYLPCCLVHGEFNPTMTETYWFVFSSIITIIVLILYYLSQDEINKLDKKRKWRPTKPNC